MHVIDGVTVFAPNDDVNAVDWGALAQMQNCAKHDDVLACALMADHHLGYAVPIGGVIAYGEHLSPSGVGYDIGCGNLAVLTDACPEDVEAGIEGIMAKIKANIQFGIGKTNTGNEHKLLEDGWHEAWSIPFVKSLQDLARSQLGTVGSGNHYVDVFLDERRRVWIGVHFGSRGLGHKIATHYVKAGGGKDGINVDPVLLHQSSELGHEYALAMDLAGEYARAGREWVCNRVASLMGCNILESIHNHHNFAWYEYLPHLGPNGKWAWVVRKGATPAYPGQRGFVGASMGEESVILKGAQTYLDDSAKQRAAIYSTIHGAGRAMSRSAAKKTLDPDTITRKALGVCLVGGDLDEAPGAYKRLPEVIAGQGETVEILHRLKPLGVAMAGRGDYDPYRD